MLTLLSRKVSLTQHHSLLFRYHQHSTILYRSWIVSLTSLELLVAKLICRLETASNMNCTTLKILFFIFICPLRVRPSLAYNVWELSIIFTYTTNFEAFPNSTYISFCLELSSPMSIKSVIENHFVSVVSVKRRNMIGICLWGWKTDGRYTSFYPYLPIAHSLHSLN